MIKLGSMVKAMDSEPANRSWPTMLYHPLHDLYMSTCTSFQLTALHTGLHWGPLASLINRGADVSTTHFGRFDDNPWTFRRQLCVNFVHCLISVTVSLPLCNVRSNA